MLTRPCLKILTWKICFPPCLKTNEWVNVFLISVLMKSSGELPQCFAKFWLALMKGITRILVFVLYKKATCTFQYSILMPLTSSLLQMLWLRNSLFTSSVLLISSPPLNSIKPLELNGLKWRLNELKWSELKQRSSSYKCWNLDPLLFPLGRSDHVHKTRESPVVASSTLVLLLESCHEHWGRKDSFNLQTRKRVQERAKSWRSVPPNYIPPQICFNFGRKPPSFPWIHPEWSKLVSSPCFLNMGQKGMPFFKSFHLPWLAGTAWTNIAALARISKTDSWCRKQPTSPCCFFPLHLSVSLWYLILTYWLSAMAWNATTRAPRGWTSWWPRCFQKTFLTFHYGLFY